MDYCGPRGLPHSVFLGWDDLDQAKALAWQQHSAQTCPGCGFHPDLTDPDRGGDPGGFDLADVLCHTCEISATARAAQHDTDAQIPGVRKVWRMVPPDDTDIDDEQEEG